MEDTIGVAFALNNLGVQALCQGNYGQATALYEESLNRYRSVGDPHAISLVLNNLGVVAQYQGQYERAADLYQESLALRRNLGDKKRIADGLFNLGEVALLQGDYKRAANLYRESLLLWGDLDAKEGLARCFAGLCGVIIRLGRLEGGTQFYSAAQAEFRRLGLLLDPTERDLLENNVEIAKSELAGKQFEDAWRSGQNLSLAEAVQWASAVVEEQMQLGSMTSE
jgi:tetratricopeptide (TPR) repeat protein